MKSGIKLLLGISLLLVTSGCWDAKNIQQLAYVTTIGFDYKDGKYIAYIQTLNFSNIAKTEQVPLGKKIPVWVGKGTGKSVAEAISTIYETSQFQLYFGHVRTCLFTERLLRKDGMLKDTYDAINRYRDVRYNINFYGTKANMNDLLTQGSIFNLSPLESNLMNYQKTYTQRSMITPLLGLKVIADLNEVGRTTLLPTISLTKKVWQEDKKDMPMFIIDGAFVFKDDVTHSFQGWMSEGDLRGARWLSKKFRRDTLQLLHDHTSEAVLILDQVRSKVKVMVEEVPPRYRIYVTVSGYLDELAKNMSIGDMEKQAAKEIRNEILHTYRTGLKRKMDALNLKSMLYRNHNKMWRQMRREGLLELTEESIDFIDVEVFLKHTGKYKGKT